jgi:hypothetical protein
MACPEDASQAWLEAARPLPAGSCSCILSTFKGPSNLPSKASTSLFDFVCSWQQRLLLFCSSAFCRCSTQASDHFTSTLSFVLDQLTGHETLRHQPPPDGPDTATATATAAAVATAAVTGVGEPTVAPAPQAEP